MHPQAEVANIQLLDDYARLFFIFQPSERHWTSYILDTPTQLIAEDNHLSAVVHRCPSSPPASSPIRRPNIAIAWDDIALEALYDALTCSLTWAVACGSGEIRQVVGDCKDPLCFYQLPHEHGYPSSLHRQIADHFNCSCFCVERDDILARCLPPESFHPDFDNVHWHASPTSNFSTAVHLLAIAYSATGPVSHPTKAKRPLHFPRNVLWRRLGRLSKRKVAVQRTSPTTRQSYIVTSSKLIGGGCRLAAIRSALHNLHFE